MFNITLKNFSFVSTAFSVMRFISWLIDFCRLRIVPPNTVSTARMYLDFNLSFAASRVRLIDSFAYML